VAKALGLAAENVCVISPFVGGAFGTCLRSWLRTLMRRWRPVTSADRSS
jgi:hypothetical protein